MSAHGVADACAAGSVCLFGTSLVSVELVVQIIAGSLAALAALASLILHVYHWIHRK